MYIVPVHLDVKLSTLGHWTAATNSHAFCSTIQQYGSLQTWACGHVGAGAPVCDPWASDQSLEFHKLREDPGREAHEKQCPIRMTVESGEIATDGGRGYWGRRDERGDGGAGAEEPKDRWSNDGNACKTKHGVRAGGSGTAAAGPEWGRGGGRSWRDRWCSRGGACL